MRIKKARQDFRMASKNLAQALELGVFERRVYGEESLDTKLAIRDAEVRLDSVVKPFLDENHLTEECLKRRKNRDRESKRILLVSLGLCGFIVISSIALVFAVL